MLKAEETNEPQVNSLKLIPFWANNPTTWFIQAEAQFKIAKITSESSRFYHVLSALPQEVIESIVDFIQSPPEVDLYSNIKKVLIERHSLSVEKRLEKIISNEDIGDRKPSDFYRSLKQLAGTSGTIGDQLIRKLWLRRLPQSINLALIPQAEKDIADVLVLADKIWEATQIQNISSVVLPSTSSTNPIQTLQQELNEIKEQLRNLNINNRQSRFRNRSNNGHFRNSSYKRNDSRSRNRSASRNKYRSNNSYCWYHFKFGQQAKKCNEPCSFNNKPTISKN